MLKFRRQVLGLDSWEFPLNVLLVTSFWMLSRSRSRNLRSSRHLVQRNTKLVIRPTQRRLNTILGFDISVRLHMIMYESQTTANIFHDLPDLVDVGSDRQ